MLAESSPEWSTSLDKLLLTDASIEDVSVFEALMLESLGVEASPHDS